MNIWIDAQLPPTLANWLTDTFGVEATALRDLGLRDARDIEIFEAAGRVSAVLMTKDIDTPRSKETRILKNFQFICSKYPDFRCYLRCRVPGLNPHRIDIFRGVTFPQSAGRLFMSLLTDILLHIKPS